MQNFNYHTHTYRCGHADYSMSDEDYVKYFIEKGFEKIAFTDHCPQKIRIDKRLNMRMDYKDKEGYYKSINFLKEKYKDKIDIELGFEVEYAPGLEECLFELKNETDKLILGQHFVYDENKENIKVIGWGATNGDDIIRYARYIEKAMELNIPNIIAHPDLFMLNNSFGEIEKEATHIICSAAEKYGVPLEINLTRAAMYLNKMTTSIAYPCKEFWTIASTYNLKVVYGVDAHAKYQIELFEKSIELVKKIIGENVINKLNLCKEDLR